MGMRWMEATSRGFEGEFAIRAGPDHDRRDHEAGARAEVVQRAEHVRRPEQQVHFLVQLPQGRRLDIFSRVAHAAGQRPLSRVVPEGRGPPRQDEGRVVAPGVVLRQAGNAGAEEAVHHRDGHRRAARAPAGGRGARVGALGLEVAEVRLDAAPQGLIAAHRIRVPGG